MRLRFLGGVVGVSGLVLLFSAVPAGAADEVTFPRGSARVGALPVIPVRITNETGTMLSLSVTSAACTPRILSSVSQVSSRLPPSTR
jgi:hypothetical protein